MNVHIDLPLKRFDYPEISIATTMDCIFGTYFEAYAKTDSTILGISSYHPSGIPFSF